MTQIFLSYLLTSLVGTVAALVLFLIRPLTKKWFSAFWHYYVWAVVLLVMLVPLKADVQKVNLWEEKIEKIDSNASIKTGFDVVTENENIVQIKSEMVKTEAAAMGEEAKEESQQKTVPEEKTVVKKHQNETKTDKDYYDLSEEIVDALKYYPLPMYDLLRLIEPCITTTEYSVQFTLLQKNALTSASEVTAEETLQQKQQEL